MSGRQCPVCGQEECGLHDGVLAVANVVDRCALVATALLTGLIGLACAIAAR
jgi:hypothetical protein